MNVVERIFDDHAEILTHLRQLWWLCVVGVTLVVLQTMYKVWLDRRQEKRFQEMLRLAGIHGKVSDAQAGRVDQAANTIEDKYNALAKEVHDLNERVRNLTHSVNNVLNKLAEPVVPGT